MTKIIGGTACTPLKTSGGGGSNMLTVTFDGSNRDKVSHSSREIYSHVASGGTAVFFDGTYYHDLITCEQNEAVFVQVWDDNIIYRLVVSADAGYEEQEILFSGGVTSVNGQTGDVKIAVTNGKDGEDGYTPVKGVDYFDGEDGKDGYTPIKGVDYFDGSNGKDGEDGKDGVSPTISVTTITGGHRVTITDANGTKTFDVMNGADGKDGEDGNSASITIDDALDENSTNPVQNKVIVAAVQQLLENVITPYLLPVVTADDNGKIPQVVDGVWSAVSMTDVSEVGM